MSLWIEIALGIIVGAVTLVLLQLLIVRLITWDIVYRFKRLKWAIRDRIELIKGEQT